MAQSGSAANNGANMGCTFDIPVYYKLIKFIGQGAYGSVWSAVDTRTKQKVAIKKITNAFDHLTDTKRTLREIKLLKHFQGHHNILGIVDIVKPTKRNYSDVYIVSQLMDTDLHQIIRSKQPLGSDHCQYFVYQMMCGLKYIHSACVLHRDLKPSNILVNRNCDLKICDFGLARVAHPQENANYTEYVATRWYRAPEIMLAWRSYTTAVDVWSVGCIMAEILGRRPLFPGKDYLHQLMLITDVIGSPTEDDIKNGSEKAKKYLRGLPRREKVPWTKMYPYADAMALDLLDKMLTFDPEKRITVDEALAHPYLAPLSDPDLEPVTYQIFNFDFENTTLTKQTLQELIVRECADFHSDVLDWYYARSTNGDAA